MAQARKYAVGMSTLALLLGLAAAPASARKLPFKILKYQVVYKGSGTYSVTQTGSGGTFTDVKSSFHWTAHYNLFVIDKKGQNVGAGAGPLSVGAGDWSIKSNNGGSESCTRSGGLKLAKGGGIFGAVQSTTGAVILKVTPGASDYTTTDGSSGGQACDTTDFWHDWVENFSKAGSSSEGEVDPLTGFVKLKRNELSFGKVVINVSNALSASEQVDPSCNGGSGGGSSCTQSFEWKGSVTFKKAGRPH